MIDLYFWAWIVGYAWFWRYHVGYVLDDFVYGEDPDGVDLMLAFLLGSLGTLIWPATVTGRGVYVLWAKYGADNTAPLTSFFPAPKEIETSWEKKQRLEREDRDKIQTRQREINEHERANGLEVTRW